MNIGGYLMRGLEALQSAALEVDALILAQGEKKASIVLTVDNDWIVRNHAFLMELSELAGKSYVATVPMEAPASRKSTTGRRWAVITAAILLSPLAMVVNWGVTAASFFSWDGVLGWQQPAPMEIVDASLKSTVLRPGEPLEIGITFLFDRPCLMTVDRVIYKANTNEVAASQRQMSVVPENYYVMHEPITRMIKYNLPVLDAGDYIYRGVVQSDCGGGNVYMTRRKDLFFSVVSSSGQGT